IQLRAPLVLAIVGIPLSYIPFIVCARFRTPLLPLLGIAAGGAVAHAMRRPPRRDWMTMSAAAALGAIIAWPNWYGVRGIDFPEVARDEAHLYAEAAAAEQRDGHGGRALELVQRARDILDRATREHPRSPVAWSTRGGFASVQGDSAGARAAYD